MSKRVELGLVVLILAVGALFRFLWLDTIPAGWHHDEALMGIMASEVFRGISRPIFFPAFLGQEPLYVYLSAGMMWLMGGDQGILPLRIVSALLGVATIGVTYALGREMFNRRVGLIGSALIALSFWQILLDRDGYRVPTQPLLEGLAVLFLWKATKRQSLWWYVAAGVALGGTIYTYLGARAFPGVLVLFGLWWLVVHGWPKARVRMGLGVFVVVAALVAAPLLYYFATNPGTFSARISQLSVIDPGLTDQNPLMTIVRNTGRLLAAFTVRSFGLWRFDLASQPIFQWGVGLLFYVGIIAAIRDILRRRAASAMVIAWIAVMLVPCILSTDVGGYALRAVGLAPAIFLLPALGFVALWDWLVPRVPQPRQQMAHFAFTGLIVAILLFEGALTYRHYFVSWANHPEVAKETMADVVVAARFLDQEAAPDSEDVFVSSQYCPHPTIAHLAPSVFPKVRWFDGATTIVFSPTSGKNALYAFPMSALPTQLDRFMPAEARVKQVNLADGSVEMAAYRLPPEQTRAAVDKILADPSLVRANKTLGDELELLSYQVQPRVKLGDPLTITAVWRVLKGAPSKDYVIFSHFLNDKNGLYRQVDSTDFRSSAWRAGDVFVGQYVMDIKNWVPTGKYSVVIGVYERPSLQRLPIQGENSDQVLLGYVDVVGE
jgi:4-amino-4-deoxy-L-arabinose transferase-like glycosyltransferase